MIKKWVSKHDFVSGKPKYQPNGIDQNIFINTTDSFIVSNDSTITIGNSVNHFTNPSIILRNSSNEGDIFSVSDTGIYYQGQPLVTEVRLRDIVREVMGGYLVRE
jgi:hypothetical protein